MNKKHFTVAACLIILAGLTLTLSRDVATGQSQAGAPRHSVPEGLPEHVAYEFLFRRAVFFRERAAAAGNPRAVNPSLKREAGLRDEQARALEEIAAACLQEMKTQDEKARAVIAAYRARYPTRVVPPGQSLPPPPPELEALQRERDAILLRGRDRLRAALGGEDFARLSEFVRARFGSRKEAQQ